MQRSIWLIATLLVLASCAGNEESVESDGIDIPLSEEDSTDNLEERSEYLDDFSEQPENIEILRDVFHEPHNGELDSIHVDILQESWDNTPILPFQAEKLVLVNSGWVFVYQAYGGASDIYNHSTFSVAYFNENGSFGNRVSVNCLDNDIRVSIIQDKYVCIRNEYPEYVHGEYVMESTGENVIERHYFVCRSGKIQKIEEVESEQLPYLRNEIYAFHGYIFKSAKYADYFSQMDWYIPEHDNVDHLVSDKEKRLADYLKQLELREEEVPN